MVKQTAKPLRRFARIEKWLLVLLMLQVLCWGAAEYAYSRVLEIQFGFELPTPSCPQGNKFMPIEPSAQLKLGPKCYEERLKLYLQPWMVPLFWVMLVGSGLCVVCGGTLLGIQRIKGHYTHRLRLLAGILIAAAVVEFVWLLILNNPFGNNVLT